MKIQIKSVATRTPGQVYWRVTLNNNTTNYPDYAGAYEYVKKYLKRYYKESAAYSRLLSLTVKFLSDKELDLVNKLKRSKCKGITKAQYGYLVGIHERQVREW